MFDFDEGQSGGEEGPFLNWHARGTQDGEMPPKSFSLRDDGDRTDVTKKMEKGVIFDITRMKTGWQFSEGLAGVAPDWHWNANMSRFEDRPDDKAWKKGFSIPLAIGGGKTAVWQQAGAGAFGALTNLAPELKAQSAKNAGLLPLVKFADSVPVKFKKGGTVVPTLEIVKWVEAPDCLNAASVDTGDGKSTEAEVEDTQIDEDEEY